MTRQKYGTRVRVLCKCTWR